MNRRLRLYALLGLGPEADDLSIRRAFKKLSAQLDPARGAAPPDAQDRARALRAAYDVPADPERRAAYHDFGEAALAPGFDAREARARVAREEEAARRRARAALLAPAAVPRAADAAAAVAGAPRDWSLRLAIGPGEAKSGRVIRVPITRPVPCPGCGGSGRRERACPACAGEKKRVWLRGEACEACHGVGLFAQGRARCRRCKGRGRRGRSLCAACAGCGQEVARAECQVCAGRGLRVSRVEAACEACAATGLVACRRCAGAKTVPKRLALRLRVPRRAEEGMVYRYAGAGFSPGDEPAGDLCVQFTILARAPRR